MRRTPAPRRLPRPPPRRRTPACPGLHRVAPFCVCGGVKRGSEGHSSCVPGCCALDMRVGLGTAMMAGRLSLKAGRWPNYCPKQPPTGSCRTIRARCWLHSKPRTEKARTISSPPGLPAQSLVEPLSHCESEVLRLVALGLSNREISERLFLALDTVKGHNRRIFANYRSRGAPKPWRRPDPSIFSLARTKNNTPKQHLSVCTSTPRRSYAPVHGTTATKGAG